MPAHSLRSACSGRARCEVARQPAMWARWPGIQLAAADAACGLVDVATVRGECACESGGGRGGLGWVGLCGGGDGGRIGWEMWVRYVCKGVVIEFCVVSRRTVFVGKYALETSCYHAVSTTRHRISRPEYTYTVLTSPQPHATNSHNTRHNTTPHHITSHHHTTSHPIPSPPPPPPQQRPH